MKGALRSTTTIGTNVHKTILLGRASAFSSLIRGRAAPGGSGLENSHKKNPFCTATHHTAEAEALRPPYSVDDSDGNMMWRDTQKGSLWHSKHLAQNLSPKATFGGREGACREGAEGKRGQRGETKGNDKHTTLKPAYLSPRKKIYIHQQRGRRPSFMAPPFLRPPKRTSPQLFLWLAAKGLESKGSPGAAFWSGEVPNQNLQSRRLKTKVVGSSEDPLLASTAFSLQHLHPRSSAFPSLPLLTGECLLVRPTGLGTGGAAKAPSRTRGGGTPQGTRTPPWWGTPWAKPQPSEQWESAQTSRSSSQGARRERSSRRRRPTRGRSPAAGAGGRVREIGRAPRLNS
eukprot:RCo026995